MEGKMENQEDQEKQESKENQSQTSQESQQRTYKFRAHTREKTAWPNKAHFTKDWMTSEEILDFIDRNLHPYDESDRNSKKALIEIYQEKYGPLTGLSLEDVADSISD